MKETEEMEEMGRSPSPLHPFTPSPVHPLPGRTDARQRLVTWQAAALALLAAGSLALLIWRPQHFAVLLVACWIGSGFLNGLYRVWAAILSTRVTKGSGFGVQGSVTPEPRTLNPEPLADDDLPTYTILIPLYHEAPVVPQLLAGIRALNYPAHLLQTFCLLRADDHETRRAVEAEDRPPGFGVLVQPEDLPVGTKPAACNYALARATGEMLVIYDAEDVPERDQLRQAAAALLRGPADLVCVETPRVVYNAGQNWITRVYEVESLSWHLLLLPALMRCEGLGPLHGSGAHFRTQALRDLGAWDYYNVTEDCDLGVRIYRAGLRIELLNSTTGEEAAPTARDWVRQRTRWNKGFLQTFFVHTRNPLALVRSLGPRGAFAFTLLLIISPGSFLIGVPAWLASLAWMGYYLASGKSALQPWALSVVLPTLNVGAILILLAMGLNAAAVIKARRWSTLPYVLFGPVHWLLLCAAAYRAVWQFFVAPFGWEKTPHGHTAQPR